MLTALRGALGFLSRLPVGRDERAWTAFRTTPATFPLAAYLVGGLAAVPLLLPLPAPTVALGYVVAVYAVTGINHLDGVADCGDAAVVHGDAARRREVADDTVVGVGAALAVGLVLAGVALGALGLVGLPSTAATLPGTGLSLPALPLAAVGVAVAAEVGAKLGMAGAVCFGEASHDGMGAALADRLGPGSLVVPLAFALPAALLTWPSPAAAAGVAGGALGGGVVVRWANRALGGVNGDVFGAVNEVGRVVGLHAGVVAWTLS